MTLAGTGAILDSICAGPSCQVANPTAALDLGSGAAVPPPVFGDADAAMTYFGTPDAWD